MVCDWLIELENQSACEQRPPAPASAPALAAGPVSEFSHGAQGVWWVHMHQPQSCSCPRTLVIFMGAGVILTHAGGSGAAGPKPPPHSLLTVLTFDFSGIPHFPNAVDAFTVT